MKNIMYLILIAVVILAIRFSPLSSILSQKKVELLGSEIEKNKGEALSQEAYDLDLIGFGAPSMNLSSTKGNVVFLNFWGIWCPPCRAEMPSIEKLYSSYNDKVSFVMIALPDRRGELGNVIEFLRENNYSFPAFVPDALLHPQIAPSGVPRTLLIGKNGEIAIDHVGARDWDDKKVREVVDSLLSVPAI